MLPQLPSATNLGAWETIVSVPDPLVAGADVRLVQDDGDVDWYDSGLTSKTGEQTDLQKDLGLDFVYAAPTPITTSTAVTTSASPAAPGSAVTLTATVTGPSDEAAPTGSVTFSVVGSDGSSAQCTGGNTVAVSTAGTATCTLAPGQLRASGVSYSVTASYLGTTDFAPSSATLTQAVTGIKTTTVAASISLLPTTARPIDVLAAVAPSKLAKQLLTGAATITVTNAAGTVVYRNSQTLPSLLPIALFSIPGGVLSVGTSTVTVSYPGDEYYSPSSTTFTVRLSR